MWEQWSRQDTIQLQPENMTISNVTGIGDYDVGPVTIQRQMQDVMSFRLGGELVLDSFDHLVRVDVGDVPRGLEPGSKERPSWHRSLAR